MTRGPLATLALLVVLAGCGGAAPAPGPTSSSATAPPTASPPAAPAVAAVRPQAAPRPASVLVHTAPGYGRLLVDRAGRTLYLFTADHGRTSSCTGACAVAWPPLIVQGSPGAGPGLRGSRLSLVRRSGGQLQLAYYGHPLYYYVGDRQAGQINCQDAEEYGGHWWLVGPDGQQNRSTPG